MLMLWVKLQVLTVKPIIDGVDSAKSAQVHTISLAVFTYFPLKTMTHEIDLTY